MKLLEEKLQAMQDIDIREAKPEDLVDISDIKIDMKQPVSNRVRDYVETVHNPFLVKVGDYVVKLGYSDCEETINDRMEQFITKMAEVKY